MKFATKTRTMYNNDTFDYVVGFSSLDETHSWSERYQDGLNAIRAEIEEIDDIDTEDEDYKPMDENAVIERVYDWMNMEREDFEFNMEHLDHKKDGECVIFGSIRRWNGTEHGCRFASSIYKAIRWCINDMDGVHIKQVNGHIEIECVHHDGRNSYEIHLLNERGLKLKEKMEWGDDYKADITDRHYHKAMPLYLECA